MSSSSDAGSNVITASCTLLSPSRMSDGSCQAITLHTSSQKIVVPVAAVNTCLGKQSAIGDPTAGSTDTAVTLGSREKPAAADAASLKPASQKTGSSNPVTRRVRFQAKPNISKNARVR